MRGIASRVAAAALLAAAAYAGLPTTSAAYAATCSSAGGVSVVVDFQQLGGGVQSACVSDGGGRLGSDLFTQAGFALTYVQRQPGFVCRVEGLPTAEQDPCVTTPDASAYWSLWWTDGTTGRWTYSTSNVGGLRVPDGGYVAFSWNTGSRPAPPGVTPVVRPEPVDTTTPTSKPSKLPSRSAAPSPTPTTPASTDASAAGSASASASPKPSRKPRPKPSTQASETPPEAAPPSDLPSSTPSDQTLPTSAEPEPSDDALPGWIAPAVIGVLFAGAGVVAVLRRRRTPGGP